MPLQYRGCTTLTPVQLEEFERVFTSFTDAPREDVALVRDLEYMLKCLGYGYRRVSEEELVSLRTVVDPTDTGLMTYESFVSVIGRFVAPPSDDEYLLGEGEGGGSTTPPAETRSRGASVLTGTGDGDFIGVVGRQRSSSTAGSSRKRSGSQIAGGNNLTAHRNGTATGANGGDYTSGLAEDRTMEMWSTFKLFDRDGKGHITAGDLSLASTAYCGSMLSERDCFFIVNTLKTGWVRDGLTIDDFTKAMLK